MLKAMQVVVDEVNAAGGVLGRKIELVVEDDQTNPEAAVRAARKLIEVNKVPAIMGTWASAVTSAVAPVCWESKTFLTTVSGADPITQLPHQGFLIRTQPNSQLQGKAHAHVHRLASGTSASSSCRSRRRSPIPTRDRLEEILQGQRLGAGRRADLREGEDDLSLRGRRGAAEPNPISSISTAMRPTPS